MQNQVVLLVDDENDALLSLSRALSSHEFQVTGSTQVSKALELQRELKPAVAVVDLSLDATLGVQAGFNLITELLRQDPSCRVIVLTGHGSDEYGVKALSLGAANFLRKPAELSHLKALIEDGLTQSHLRREYTRLLSESASPLQSWIVGESPAVKKLREELSYAAHNSQPVFLAGETGTGKGLCAWAIHQSSLRSAHNFVRYQPNFATSDLVHSELFGHLKGAFTGADSNRRGLLSEADQGTLFLDEVDELPSETQVCLLGVLQDRKFRALGSNREEQVDFRLICASNRDLREALETKKLRQDFYHRVAHFKIELPPLRLRLMDIDSLAHHFLNQLRVREQVNVFELSNDCVDRLQNYDWPGNVRELQAVVEGAAYRANFEQRAEIRAADLNFQGQSEVGCKEHSFHTQVQRYKHELVQKALQSCAGNQVKAAKELGLDRSVLRRIIANGNATKKP